MANLVPTMYPGFLSHSPLPAQSSQSPCLSAQSWTWVAEEEERRPSGRKGRLWIHLVADHFVPARVGQPVCKLYR